MRKDAGYSLIEVLVAAGILAMAVAAAAALSLAISAQEEMSARAAVALNYQEQAAKLWRLGLSESEINAILPQNEAVQSLVFEESNVAFSGIGTLRQAVCTISFQLTPDAGNWTPLTWTAGSQQDAPVRTYSVVLLRPVVP